jgi:hypothetical protein
MNSMSAKVECVTSAKELRGCVNDLPLTTIMTQGLYGVSSVDPATKYLVTFEMTIKPLPEGPSTSASHPRIDGLEK